MASECSITVYFKQCEVQRMESKMFEYTHEARSDLPDHPGRACRLGSSSLTLSAFYLIQGLPFGLLAHDMVERFLLYFFTQALYLILSTVSSSSTSSRRRCTLCTVNQYQLSTVYHSQL